MITRDTFNNRQLELCNKIKTIQGFYFTPGTSDDDKLIYHKQIKIMKALKKRNATLFSKQAKQLTINI